MATDRLHLLRELVEGAPDALFVKDLDGRYLLINRAGAEMIGLTPEQVLGHTDDELFDPESAQAIRHVDEEILTSGRVDTHEETSTDSFGVTRHYLATKGPLRDEEGELMGTFGIARDITEAKRTAEALRRSEADLKARVKELTTLYAVTAELARDQIPFEDRLQRAVRLVPDGWQYPGITEARLSLPVGDFQTAGFRGTPWFQRSEVKAGRGRVGFVEVCYTEERPPADEGPFLDEERRLLDALAAIVGDSLDRRRLHEQLRLGQKLEAVGTLAGGIAHEFNNLLTAIGGHAELMIEELERLSERGELLEDARSILQVTQRARELAGQLLAFSRRQGAGPGVVDLAEAVPSLGVVLRRLVGEDVRLETDVRGEALRVRLDEAQLGQILLRLCLNSREAEPTGGTITIRAYRERIETPLAAFTGGVDPGEWAVLEIADTGQGMEEEVRERLFEPFFTTKPVGKGTGLGLSVVYGVVREVGGQIDVDSVRGRGTTFRIYLPVSTSDGSKAETGAEPRGEPGSLRKTTADATVPDAHSDDHIVMVVDDEAPVRSLLSRALERQGYIVITAADGEEALRLLGSAERRPEVLISDLLMPRLGGLELLRRLSGEGIEIPTVLMTGYSEDRIPSREELPSLVGRLEKPFKPADLIATVRRVLEGRS